jgi:hypothetical protein
MEEITSDDEEKRGKKDNIMNIPLEISFNIYKVNCSALLFFYHFNDIY